ncbi:MAG: undecaprenyl-diphosphate phosphatase [Bacteroidales bacterium]|nr:undecaprenyl-diphosphate phosphatase [Bacteroidales bacterium]MBN2756797.1 undecaprenyl-diphosphate phosphatase [Bacteroidales bacterium]
MNWLEAAILGIIQGLTEFLPVSSSGHLEIGKVLLGVNVSESLTFSIVVHGATVLSTIIVFRKDIWQIITAFLKFEWNEETAYIFKIAVSIIPVGIIGLLFKDYLESLFNGNILLVGSMLIVTSILLAFTFYAKPKEKDISFKDALIIGIAQAIAVLPGISRSGATISTGLLLGNDKEKTARFSFLMVLVPIIGANIKDLMDGSFSAENGISSTALIIGFVTAFISGLLACSWMIKIVKNGKLIYFALYCLIIGLIAVSYSLFFAA